MPVFGEHPHSSITIKVNQLSSPGVYDDKNRSIELYLSDLLELIQLQQSTGAVEASRAVRKRLKYGDSVKEQLRALEILEMLVLNSGHKIGRVIANDDKLIDVLRGILTGSGKTGTGTPYDKKVRSRVTSMAFGWKEELRDIEGYKYLVSLSQSIPKARKRAVGRHTENVFDSSLDREVSDSGIMTGMKKAPPRPESSITFTSPKSNAAQYQNALSKKAKNKRKKKNGVLLADDEYQIPQINYDVEAPKIRALIADCLTQTTSLSNLLLILPPDLSPLDDKKIVVVFDKCRSIRRKVLRYLQFVGAGGRASKNSKVLALEEEFLGSLINANEQLVAVFKRFDAASGYTEADPAPNYDDEDEDSSDSYYSSDSTEEEEAEETRREIPSVEAAMRLVCLDDEGSLSRQARQVASPPPRPAKPPAFSQRFQNSLAKTDTNESDPFGDTNEVSRHPSKYY